MPNDSIRRCPFCAFEQNSLDAAGSRGRALSIFAIPDIRAMVFLQGLGLDQHATSCAAAYWKAHCQQDLEVTEQGMPAPSLDALRALSLILGQIVKSSTFRACEDLLASVSWQCFLKSCPKWSRNAYWLALHDASNKLQIASSLITPYTAMSRTQTLLNHERVKSDGTVADTSFSEPYDGPKAVHIKLHLFNPDRILYLAKPRKPFWYPVDVQLEENFKLVIRNCLEHSLHLTGKHSQIFAPPKMLHARSASIFELLTICFELSYGGHLEIINESPSKNRHIFGLLSADLASSTRGWEREGRNSFSWVSEHEQSLRAFISTCLLGSYANSEQLASQQDLRIRLVPTVKQDFATSASRVQAACLSSKVMKSSVASLNTSVTGSPQREHLTTTPAFASCSHLGIACPSVICPHSWKNSSMTSAPVQKRDGDPLIDTKIMTHEEIAPALHKDHECVKTDHEGRSAFTNRGQKPAIMSSSLRAFGALSYLAGSDAQPADRLEDQCSITSAKQYPGSSVGSSGTTAPHSGRVNACIDLQSYPLETVADESVFPPGSITTADSASGTSAVRCTPGGQMLEADAIELVDDEVPPPQEPYDPPFSQAMSSPSLKAFQNSAKANRARGSTSRSASRPSTISLMSLDHGSDRNSIYHSLFEIKSRRSDASSMDALSEGFASLGTSDKHVNPKQKTYRSHGRRDSGVSNSISFGLRLS